MNSFPMHVVQSGNPPTWGLTYNNGNGNSVSVPAKQTGDFSYTIVGVPGVTFATQNPLWIQSGTAKPAAATIDPQISNVSAGGTTTLTFHDSNTTAGTLTYSLHFSNGTQLDPIINNGGGETPPPPPPPPPLHSTNYTDIAIYVVIGLVFGFLLASAVKWIKK